MPRRITSPSSGSPSRIQEMLASHPYDLLAARNLLKGIKDLRKFGENVAIGASNEVISGTGGAVPFMPTAAVAVEAISSDGGDIDSSGAGARTICVQGLNTNFDEIEETISMNGASASDATTLTFIRVIRAFAVTTGTYRGSNIGAITIRPSGGGTTFETIVADHGQTSTTHFCVPRGKTFFMTATMIQIDSTKAVHPIFYYCPGADSIVAPFQGARREVFDFSGLTDSIIYSLSPPEVFEEMSDLWYSAHAEGGGGGASAEYHGYLIDN